MTSALDGIIPIIIEVSLEKTEPPPAPPPAQPLVLNAAYNHYVPQSEQAQYAAAYRIDALPVHSYAKPAPSEATPPPPQVPKPARVATMPVVPAERVEEPGSMASIEPANLPEPAIEQQQAALFTPDPQDEFDGFLKPLFSQPKPIITPRRVFASLGAIVIGLMATITYLWVSEKIMATERNQIAVRPIVAPAPARSDPLPSSGPVENATAILSRPIVIGSSPVQPASISMATASAPAALPAQASAAPAVKDPHPTKLPVVTPHAATPPIPVEQAPVSKITPPAKPPVVTAHVVTPPKPVATVQTIKTVQPEKPPVIASHTPTPTKPTQDRPVAQAMPPVTSSPASSTSQRPETQATTDEKSVATPHGWAVRVERNGVIFFEGGKAVLYRLGDALPNGERLVDVDESSATYATNKGIRQIRSSPLRSH